MSYWFADDNGRDAGAGRRSMAATTGMRVAGASATAPFHTSTAVPSSYANTVKPTFFSNEADVALFYPSLPGAKTIRRKKPAGENVLRSAAINDKAAHASIINRE